MTVRIIRDVVPEITLWQRSRPKASSRTGINEPSAA
jgi:hypothetical protein